MDNTISALDSAFKCIARRKHYKQRLIEEGERFKRERVIEAMPMITKISEAFATCLRSVCSCLESMELVGETAARIWDSADLAHWQQRNEAYPARITLPRHIPRRATIEMLFLEKSKTD